jgi:hypothetical protein
MNLSKIYTVLFTEGSAGTFLIWFVSQHNNFFKLQHTYLNQYTDTNKNTTIDIQSKTHRHLFLGIGSFEYSKQSLDQYLTRHFATAESSKVIFKILPHHNDGVNTHKDQLPDINIIMLTFEKYGWINSRLKSFEQSTRTETQQERDILNRESLQEYFKTKCVNYCTISIDKILNLDIAEYQKLLEFIEAPPIANWQDIIKEYKDNVGIQEII